MNTYRDAETGYEIRILNEDGRYAKPYFDTETTTPDDKCAIVTEIGHVPFCRGATSGLTEFRNGMLAASYQHSRM